MSEPPPGEAETIQRFTVTVRPDSTGEPDGTFEVRSVKPVLLEMVARGVRAIDVGCRGGGCGVCRVQVVEGSYETQRMSRRHVTEDDEAVGFALSCRLLARSNLVVRKAQEG